MENSHSKLIRKVMVVPDFMNNKTGLIYKLAAPLKRDVTIHYVCIFKLQTCATHFYLKLTTLFFVAVQLHI